MVFNLIRFANSYIVAKTINDYNEFAIQNDFHPIMSSEARDIWTEINDYLKIEKDALGQSVSSMNNAKSGKLCEAINTVMSQHTDVSADYEFITLDTYKNKYVKDFGDVMKWNMFNNKERRNGTASLDGYIPIAPCDSLYGLRDTVMQCGNEILYVSVKDIIMSEQKNDGTYHYIMNGRDLSLDNSPMLYHRTEENGSAVFNKSAGPMYVELDDSGMSCLQSVMSDSDFRVVSEWVTKDIPHNNRMSRTGIERAYGILKMLRENGILFTVEKDLYPGQASVHIGSKTKIRLTETRGNEQYIGRVYHDGNTLYPYAYVKDGIYKPSVEDTLSLVQYALGFENIGRTNVIHTKSNNIGDTIGSPSYVTSFSKSFANGENKTRPTTFMTEDQNGKSVLHCYTGYSLNQSVNKYIYSINDHSESHMIFDSNEQAEQYLKDVVSSARQRFVDEINVEYLIHEASEHADDNGYVPEFSNNKAIVPIQQKYWDVLTGKSELYRPDEKQDSEVYDVLFDALGLNTEEGFESEDNEEEEFYVPDVTSGNRYVGTREENVRAHLAESMDVLFGTYEVNSFDDKRFNPGMVASFMVSSDGIYRNKENIAAAMRKLDFTGDELRGDDYQTGLIKDSLLKFDSSSAILMSDVESPFIHSMYETIRNTIRDTASEIKQVSVSDNNGGERTVDDIRIDKNGVVSYTASQVFYDSASGEMSLRQIDGLLGQIFEPDELGLVETRYNGSENKLFSPGYNAYIVPRSKEANGGPESRIRLVGLEQVMKQNIRETIRYDLLNDGEHIVDENNKVIGRKIGLTTNINNTYRKLYTTNYNILVQKEDFPSLKDALIYQFELSNLPKDVLDARLKTASCAYHFDADIRDHATVDADYQYEKQHRNGASIYDMLNDNKADAFSLTDHTNWAIPQMHKGGYCDPVLTGSGKNQGITLYLPVGASVTSDGRIIPAEDENARAYITMTEDMKYLSNVPADRQQMVLSNIMSAQGVYRHTGIAQLTLQGWTFDDGAVISKSFAERCCVIGEKGQVRPLDVGDKICDFSGNKTIIACVVDPDMPENEAKKKGVLPAVELFRNNENLDVVQAPYSAVSRFNASGAKFAMDEHRDLVLPDGSVHEGCLGFAPMCITKHIADEHVRLYDDMDDKSIKSEKGRKVSPQLCWVFSSKNAKNIMNEVFSGNNAAVVNFREKLNILGLDCDEKMNLRPEYKPHNGEHRYLFKLPSDEMIKDASERDMINMFRNVVDSRGGFMEIPFKIDFMSGAETQQVDASEASRDRVMYKLPVLSAHLRSGQTFKDGTSSVHDYTNEYARIFMNSLKYLKEKMAYKDAEQAGKTDDMKTAENNMKRYQNNAETSFNNIAGMIRSNDFETKHNLIREDFMSRRMPHSATAVWSPNPNLDLNEVGMSPAMMKSLGVKNGDCIMLWRDPILKDSGVCYMKVKKTEGLSGIQVNPLMAVAVDGDFDGDSVGLLRLSREDSRKEAQQLFSFESTMLNESHVRENGDYELIFNVSMDVISAEKADDDARDAEVAAGGANRETLRERRLRLEHEANEVYRRTDLSDEARMILNQRILNDLSDWAKDTLCDTCATELISYKDDASHVESLCQIVDHGAKGSYKKLDDYLKYYGVTYDKDENGRVLTDTIFNTGHTLATKQDVCDTEQATAIKSHGTANGGTISQRVVMATRNIEGHNIAWDDGKTPKSHLSALSSALQLTYLATQGMLQAKHDPIQAQRLYGLLQDPLMSLWRGHELVAKDKLGEDGKIHRVWDERLCMDAKGRMRPVQLKKDEWIKTFMDIHCHPDGLDLADSVNERHVRQVAEILYDKDTHCMGDIESQKTLQKLASPMDLLMYKHSHSFDYLCDMANEGDNLFRGSKSSLFMPNVVAKNIQADKEGRIQDLIPLQAKDTKVDYDAYKNSKNGLYAVETMSNEIADAYRREDAAKKMINEDDGDSYGDVEINSENNVEIKDSVKVVSQNLSDIAAKCEAASENKKSVGDLGDD